MQDEHDLFPDLTAQGEKWRGIYNEAKRVGDWAIADFAGNQLRLISAVGQVRTRKWKLALESKPGSAD